MKQQTKIFFRDMGVALGGLASIFLFTGALFICLLLGGCTKTVYVPVENTVYSTDTVYEAMVRVDSVIQRDSVAVVQKGDTVLITRWHDRYRVRQRTDTVYKAKMDSVYVREPYPVYKTREMSAWDKTKQGVGGIAISLVSLFLLYYVAVWLIKKRKR